MGPHVTDKGDATQENVSPTLLQLRKILTPTVSGMTRALWNYRPSPTLEAAQGSLPSTNPSTATSHHYNSSAAARASNTTLAVLVSRCLMDLGCEYGDKSLDCTKYSKALVCPYYGNTLCCGYCYGYMGKRSILDGDGQARVNITLTPPVKPRGIIRQEKKERISGPH
ncbi:uncharacterized protein LOC131948164 [Physella acuta]|uniref:uncharacterized protein LOC131948164 n=1 Tax=Physella acuta TaxID=109671 RepID=UPI0027DDAABE|nr:uncharacterized protein LOC131948164 [Physella acuta]